MSTIAAPLLAAGALALFGVVVQAPDQFRLVGWTLPFLVVTIALLLVCVQAGLWARHYFAMPSEVRDWHYNRPEGDLPHYVQSHLVPDMRRYERWSVVAWWAFVLGLVVLWVALATAAMPPNDQVSGAAGRWTATVLCLGVAASEACWVGFIVVGRLLR